MAIQGTKKARKYGRNRDKCAAYRARNDRERHRGAEYRARHGIGNGYIGYDRPRS